MPFSHNNLLGCSNAGAVAEIWSFGIKNDVARKLQNSAGAATRTATTSYDDGRNVLWGRRITKVGRISSFVPTFGTARRGVRSKSPKRPGDDQGFSSF